MVATTYYPFFFASLVVLYITSEETSSFSTLITFDVDGTLVSSSPGWEEGAHARSFTHAVNSILVKSNDDDDDASASPSTIPQLLSTSFREVFGCLNMIGLSMTLYTHHSINGGNRTPRIV